MFKDQPVPCRNRIRSPLRVSALPRKPVAKACQPNKPSASTQFPLLGESKALLWLQASSEPCPPVMP